MVLAAGLGTRLQPLTDNLPKCMVPVAGKPLLQHTIEWLKSQGVMDIAVNLHYHPNAVTGYFGDGSRFDVNIRYSFESELLGTAGAVRAINDFFADARFVVVYGDNLIDCDLSRLSALHIARHATMTMALFWRADVTASGVASLQTDDRINAFKEKPRLGEAPSNWINAGLLICEPKLLSFIPPDEPSDFGHDVLPALLAAGEPLYGYRMGLGESLHWIDTPEDLASTREDLGEATAE